MLSWCPTWLTWSCQVPPGSRAAGTAISRPARHIEGECPACDGTPDSPGQQTLRQPRQTRGQRVIVTPGGGLDTGTGPGLARLDLLARTGSQLTLDLITAPAGQCRPCGERHLMTGTDARSQHRGRPAGGTPCRRSMAARVPWAGCREAHASAKILSCSSPAAPATAAAPWRPSSRPSRPLGHQRGAAGGPPRAECPSRPDSPSVPATAGWPAPPPCPAGRAAADTSRPPGDRYSV